MKSQLIAFSSIMFLSTSAFADESNVNFPAKDNQDPLFIKKCEEFRKAKADKDIDTLMSFVPKHFKDTEDEKKRAIAYLSKKAEKFQKYVTSPEFEVLSQKLSTESKSNYAQVDIRAQYGEKKFVSDGCVFELTKEDGWIIIIASS
ncbi:MULTISPECIES: hypothetical protein [unclassified Pseudoalteromonas]|uniref:hypothetical protein n=1 Tax=unclassified Pseudoalteromonas TaxID=194690 RepID=UPI001476B836|nr:MULTISPECIES: hypothetical protein [unclassified Pseudoalteromonas]MBB1305920.1 hypothetical protein [Pseudoalteromonas sp. SR43-5]MBB1350127.1 hypothetical protein [Pseudoalteromonas sp. SG45-3]MBB1356545.1 hypothetical protein [Pseudoalteromonas sp. SG45-6]NNG43677.1 hypothetical protein [Pseudoalteromonas sp. NEC-BIFX-2020_002]